MKPAPEALMPCRYPNCFDKEQQICFTQNTHESVGANPNGGMKMKPCSPQEKRRQTLPDQLRPGTAIERTAAYIPPDTANAPAVPNDSIRVAIRQWQRSKFRVPVVLPGCGAFAVLLLPVVLLCLAATSGASAAGRVVAWGSDSDGQIDVPPG